MLLIAGALSTNETPPALAYVVLIVVALGSTVSFVWRRIDLRLWQTGEAVEGELTKCALQGSGSGESRRIHTYVWYHYTVAGVNYERKRRAQATKPRPIWVVYNPEEPGKSMPTW
jgi:hypothetical protein